MEKEGVEPSSAACKAGALPVELPPRVDADGWSRTTTARGNGFTDRGAHRVLSVRRLKQGGRPDSNRHREAHDLGCCRYTTATTKEMLLSMSETWPLRPVRSPERWLCGRCSSLLCAPARGRSPASATAPSTGWTTGRIDHVADGDTVDLTNGQKIRLVQIDTPEVYFTPECYGEQASAITKRLLPPGTLVKLYREPATDSIDQYGRLLRYVVRARDGLNVNVQLVRVGAAAPYFYDVAAGPFREPARAARSAREERASRPLGPLPRNPVRPGPRRRIGSRLERLKRGRPDSNRRRLARQASALPLSYAPGELRSGAGGIRTHGLELMRLAGTASSPTALRCCCNESGRQESNLRSPVPETGGVASLPHDQMQSTPGGTRTRSSGLRARRHALRPRGRESSGGRDRTCASRLTVARLTARLHRNEMLRNGRRVGELRTAGEAGRPREPQPPVFEDGVPHHWQPFQMAPAGVEPAPHRLRGGDSSC